MGLFITLEGMEGSGKSTQMGLLRDWLEGKGKKVLVLREPGGTNLGEAVRAILLNHKKGVKIDPWTELFLYEACRAQLVKDVIIPALKSGSIVICDRFTDSTVAYQGYGRGLDVRAINAVNKIASQGLRPNLTILFDIEPVEGLKRAFKRIGAKKAGKKEDRFEKEGLGFHNRVRDGYLKTAKAEPERVRVVDGRGDISSIHAKVCGIIDKIRALR